MAVLTFIWGGRGQLPFGIATTSPLPLRCSWCCSSRLTFVLKVLMRGAMDLIK
jgi:hypothetical protein